VPAGGRGTTGSERGRSVGRLARGGLITRRARCGHVEQPRAIEQADGAADLRPMRSTRSSSAICLTVMPRRSFTRRRTSPLSARNAVRAGPAAVGERRGQPEPRPGRGSGSARTRASRCNRAPRRSPAPRASAASTGSTAAASAGSTTCCTSSPSPGPTTTRTRGPTWPARRPRARPRRERCAAPSGTWRAASTTCSPSLPRSGRWERARMARGRCGRGSGDVRVGPRRAGSARRAQQGAVVMSTSGLADVLGRRRGIYVLTLSVLALVA
jgi:hypothetical protein